MIEAILLGLFWKKVQIGFMATMIVIASILSVYTLISMDENQEVAEEIIDIYNRLNIGFIGIINKIYTMGRKVNNISVNN